MTVLLPSFFIAIDRIDKNIREIYMFSYENYLTARDVQFHDEGGREHE